MEAGTNFHTLGQLEQLQKFVLIRCRFIQVAWIFILYAYKS